MGVFGRIFVELAKRAGDGDEMMIDATDVPRLIHQNRKVLVACA